MHFVQRVGVVVTALCLVTLVALRPDIASAKTTPAPTPTITTLHATSPTQVAVSWTIPAAAASQIAKIVVLWGPGTSFAQNHTAPTTALRSYLISGLRAGATYCVQIKVIAKNGNDYFSALDIVGA